MQIVMVQQTQQFYNRFIMENNELIIVCVAVLIIQLSLVIKFRQKRYRRWWVRPVNRSRNTRGFHLTLFRELKNTDYEEFYVYTRMSPRSFDCLLNMIRPLFLKRILRGRRKPLDPELKLALTLSYLAHGDSRVCKHWEFRIGRSTVHKVINDTCHAIVKVLQPIYLSPATQEEWVKIAKDFFEIWQFPNCFGAIDGKHIRIKAPANSGSKYFNYKKYFSIVLLAVCDAQYRFTWIDIGQYGSISDSGVWANSDLGSALKNENLNLPPPKELPGTRIKSSISDSGVWANSDLGSALKNENLNLPPPKELPGTRIKSNFVLIGDEIFPLLPNLMKPYSRTQLQDRERIFNYRLSRARNTIENTFGILVTKWRILLTTICADPSNVDFMIMAIVCLHNFILSEENKIAPNRRQYCPPNYVNREMEGQILDGVWKRFPSQSQSFTNIGRLGSNNYNHTADAQRNILRNYFVSEIGESQTPWQYKCVFGTE